MSNIKFERGQVVYDKYGNKADYVENAARGHIVYPHGKYAGQPDRWPQEAWQEVYASPPSSFKAWSWLIAVLIVGSFWSYVFS